MLKEITLKYNVFSICYNVFVFILELNVQNVFF